MGAFNRRNKRVSNGSVTHLRPFRHNQLRGDAGGYGPHGDRDDADEHDDVVFVRPRHRGIYLLPNAFTTAALFAGFFAIVQAMNMRFDVAAIAIFAAMVLDGMDGRVARITHTQSAFGEQYDSLSDMTSFGVAPALVMYEWILHDTGQVGLAGSLRLLYLRGAAAGALQREYRRGRQALLPGAAEPGGGGAGGRLRLAGDRQQAVGEGPVDAVGGIRHHALCRPVDGVERAVLQWQGARRALPRAVRRDGAGAGAVRGGVHRSAGGPVRPVRGLCDLGLCTVGWRGLHGQPGVARVRDNGKGS